MTLKDYTTGCKIDIADPALLNKISQEIAKLQYGGVFIGRTWIIPDDHAYSLTIYSKDISMTFTLADSQYLSRVRGKNFTISIKNFGGLHKTLESTFD